MRISRRLLTVVAVVLCVISFPVAAQRAATVQEWNLPALMAAMRQVRASTARFAETRYIHLLNQAQRSSGRLNYVAPGYLQKVTSEPAPARLTISGDRLTIEQQGQPTRDISLRGQSEIGALVESVRATLAGDLPALTRYFTVSLDGGANDWTLTLVPNAPKLREMVATIRIQGQQNAVRDVQTLEADGDRTDMVVTPDPK